MLITFIIQVRKVRGGAFMISRPSSRFWSPSVLSWRAWFLRTSTGSTNKKSLPAGSYLPYSLQPWLQYSTASVSDRVIKIAQQTKLNHWHLHVKVSLQKAFMVIVSHVPAYQRAFVFGLFSFDFLLLTQNSEEVSFLKVWFYLWVPVRWVASVRQLKCWNTWLFFFFLF